MTLVKRETRGMRLTPLLRHPKLDTLQNFVQMLQFYSSTVFGLDLEFLQLLHCLKKQRHLRPRHRYTGWLLHGLWW